MTTDVKEVVRRLSEEFEKSRKIVWKTDKGLDLKIQILINESQDSDVPYYMRKGTPVVFRMERTGYGARVYHSIEALAKAIIYEME